jgi:hypothetical protein
LELTKQIENIKYHKKGIKLDGIVFDRLEFEEKKIVVQKLIEKIA